MVACNGLNAFELGSARGLRTTYSGFWRNPKAYWYYLLNWEIGMKILGTVFASVLLSLLMMSSAQAQPEHLTAGSILVFPHYAVSKGGGTVTCVTNTNVDTTYCESEDVRAGDVLAHYIYIDGEDWSEFDRYEVLTPGDTLCTITGRHNPDAKRGFLLVVAVDPTEPSKRIDFDYLIGSALIVDGKSNFFWSYTPYVFKGLPQDGAPAACTHNDTDDNGDGNIDFDGTEYPSLRSRIVIDSFFEESGMVDTKLTLMSFAGADYTNDLNMYFWNNEEQKFSRSFRFTCYWRGSLSEISSIVRDLGGSTDESGPLMPQTGWLEIVASQVRDGAGNPVGQLAPVLPMMNASVPGTNFMYGHAGHVIETSEAVNGVYTVGGD